MRFSAQTPFPDPCLDPSLVTHSADLVVLGAYYGKGANAGMRSVFLMGCWDSASQQWRTVCKVALVALLLVSLSLWCWLYWCLCC